MIERIAGEKELSKAIVVLSLLLAAAIGVCIYLY